MGGPPKFNPLLSPHPHRWTIQVTDEALLAGISAARARAKAPLAPADRALLEEAGVLVAQGCGMQPALRARTEALLRRLSGHPSML